MASNHPPSASAPEIPHFNILRARQPLPAPFQDAGRDVRSVAIKKLLFDKNKIVSDDEAHAIEAIQAWVKETESMLSTQSTGSNQLAQFAEFVANDTASAAELKSHIQTLTMELSTSIISNNRLISSVKTILQALKRLPVESMLEFYVTRDPLLGPSVNAILSGLGSLYVSHEAQASTENEIPRMVHDEYRLQQLESAEQQVSSPALEASTTVSQESLSQSTIYEDSENEDPVVITPTKNAPAQPADDLSVTRQDLPSPQLMDRQNSEGAGSVSMDASGGPPSHKRKRNPTPDHYQFGIVNYWKNAAVPIQSAIERIYKGLERQSNEHSEVNLNASTWNTFFWVPEKENRKTLTNWPPMIQDLTKRFPDPTVFDLSKLQDAKYSRFRALYKKLRSPIMIAAAWERTHVIYPNIQNDPAMKTYLNARRSRTSQLRKVWLDYAQEVKKLVESGDLPVETIVDPSLPIPSKTQHPWDLVDTNDLKKSLEQADQESKQRVWFMYDFEQHPFNQQSQLKKPRLSEPQAPQSIPKD